MPPRVRSETGFSPSRHSCDGVAYVPAERALDLVERVPVFARDEDQPRSSQKDDRVEVVHRYSKHSDRWERLRRLGLRLASQAPDQPKRRSETPRRSHKLNQRASPELMAAVVRDYQAGISTPQLTVDYDLGKSSVLRILHESGVAMRRQGLNPIDVEAAAELYRAGQSLATVGRRFGCGPDNLRSALIARGVTIRPRRGWPYG